MNTPNPNNNRKFYLSTGELTAYGLHCGYIEQDHNHDMKIELYNESGCYQVRLIDFYQKDHTAMLKKHSLKAHNNPAHPLIVVWYSFDRTELTKARQLYRKLQSYIKRKRPA